jgi:subtilisin family serine protease
MGHVKRVLLGILLVSITTTLSAQSGRSVLIRAAQPYDALVAAIEQAGGTVTHRFKHVGGIAAELPESALAQIEKLVGPDNIARDEIIPLPEVNDPRGGAAGAEAEADDVVMLDGPGAPIEPANYNFNATLTNVAPLHASGRTGAGVVIAVIDSGYRPVKVHVAPSRIVAPGLNLVPGMTEPPAISDLNQPHGTFVSGMAAANIAFCFSIANKFVVVAEHYGAAFPSIPPCSATTRLVPMVGSAPGASIFPIKVFPAAGGGSPTSRVIAAMEAAIDLRRKYDNGEPGGLNIRVANLSLGGPTQAAARELDDAAIEALINADIVPVVAAGNEGFSSVTTGSPSTSFAALTVGSASDHRHEQIFRAQFSAPCGLATWPLATVLACAQSYRPDTNVHVSEFSSRGPTHDGRTDPDVVAIGSFNYSQSAGASTTVNFGSGTSYSTPTVSGIAAVLRQAVPWATARQVRLAIIESADPTKIPTAGVNDQGAGFVNAAAAMARLQAGGVPDTYATAGFTRNLKANMQHAGHKVYAGPKSLHFEGVRPAEVTDIPFVVSDKTEQLFVRIHGISAALPPAQQNQFFTDDMFLKIQSSVVHNDDLVAAEFVVAGQEKLYTFPRPAEGIWRISPSGDWTNAGTISYSVDIWSTSEPFPEHTAKETIAQGESHVYTIEVPIGTTSLEARLEWMNMNGNYPISDVDVILTPPSGPVINTCNTARTPELCVVTNPVAGAWTARVVGFSIPDFGIPGTGEHYTLRIEADNLVLQVKQ